MQENFSITKVAPPSILSFLAFKEPVIPENPLVTLKCH
uniref:Uncharacterized protein n=1 Tax=Anguilla anguilla TaxID=7936 RepID=A0A0E9UPU7_ANGAN